MKVITVLYRVDDHEGGRWVDSTIDVEALYVDGVLHEVPGLPDHDDIVEHIDVFDLNEIAKGEPVIIEVFPVWLFDDEQHEWDWSWPDLLSQAIDYIVPGNGKPMQSEEAQS